MTRQRGASRGFESKKNNQNRRFAPSEAPSKTITQATQLATPTTDSLLLSAQEGLHADFLQQGDEALAALRDRARGALAGLQRSFAAVRLQRALRRGVAMRRYVEMLRTSRARRVQEVDEQGELEGIGLRKQQLFQAVEGLQDAAGEWLVARAGQLDEDEPAWLVRAGQELEQMLQQWQQRQEERLDGRQKTQQRDLEGTPPSVGRQGRRVACCVWGIWQSCARGSSIPSIEETGRGEAAEREDSAKCGSTGRSGREGQRAKGGACTVRRCTGSAS